MIARATKKVLKDVGELKPEGRPSKEQEIIEWRKYHPNGSKAECISDTGISKPTVYKYWEIASPKG